ncbi:MULTISPECIES: siderophore-interacting protein [unclassified Janthinobacterium]|uniref:siderophore-interacting protein n=1 Tax=unclassified Janthinobacterium TaxID=2610881 RepID=UPI001618AE15|nr:MULTISPECIES: siderophore-interacting protein [unclassified Janthinobacterium]MBB5367833.1 NADPH-dependent ferric siderophore reductase [Janthinobacterium sp. K2C7]MBB5379689.1 NADPH-dependent ferric siderophore reductase [Janthinobacterium sp. K2Li3]MBB5386215.1 NADPH-dependent ferric siderophore reductase [Janthinobacterium sp. K2E3]
MSNVSTPTRQHAIERVRHDLKLRVLTVVRTEQLTAHMRRITLAGDDLEGFVSPAHDDHVKLFFPAPGQETPVFPILGNGANAIEYPEGARPIARNYTPRRYDAERRELEIDFVLHGDGPASTWAEQAKPGQTLGVGGPRGSTLVPLDFDWYVLVGDQTALPAIARRLEQLPAGARAIAVIEIAEDGEQITLDSEAQCEVRWVPRNGRSGALLLDALRQLALPKDGDGYAWVATELSQVQDLRRYLLEAGLPKQHMHVASYWKHGAAEHHQNHDD